MMKKIPVNISVHLLDALVLARSAFHHSANYRSVIIFSQPKPITNKKKILQILEVLTNRIHPNRWNDVRAISKKELLATKIIAFPIQSASAKIRTGPPIDDEEDYNSKYWAGIIPIETKREKPISDPKLNPKIKIPKYLKNNFQSNMKIPKLSSIQLIFVGMTIGLIVGWLWPEIGVGAKPLSTIFLRLIKSIIAPLIFSTLVLGIAGHGNIKQVGKIGIKAIIYFEIVTTLALLIGLFFVNTIEPGVGVKLETGDMGGIVAKKQSITEVLTHIIPQSVVQAAAEGELLQLVVFALIFSFALLMVTEEKRKPILTFLIRLPKQCLNLQT